jgi:hypothetical protein
MHNSGRIITHGAPGDALLVAIALTAGASTAAVAAPAIEALQMRPSSAPECTQPDGHYTPGCRMIAGRADGWFRVVAPVAPADAPPRSPHGTAPMGRVR